MNDTSKKYTIIFLIVILVALNTCIDIWCVFLLMRFSIELLKSVPYEISTLFAICYALIWGALIIIIATLVFKLLSKIETFIINMCRRFINMIIKHLTYYKVGKSICKQFKHDIHCAILDTMQNDNN